MKVVSVLAFYGLVFCFCMLVISSLARADQYSKEEWYRDITRDIQPAEPKIQQQRYMIEQPHQIQTPQPVDRSYEYKYRRDDNCTSLRCAR